MMKVPRLTVRRLMVLVAVVAVLHLAAIRGGPAIVLANYHWQQERYHRAQFERCRQVANDRLEDESIRRSNRLFAERFQDEVAFHAYWRRVFFQAAFRIWERIPATSQEFPPRRK